MKTILITTILFLAISCAPENEGNSTEVASKSNDTSIDDSKAKSAETVALEFINSYVENCNKLGEAQAVLLWVNESPLASQTLRNELRILVEKAIADDPEIGLDYDPLFNAQDYPEKGFVVESIGTDNNLVFLKGVGQPEFKITVKMAKKGGKWFVDGCGAVNVPASIQGK